jgi:cysteine desulfurase/selenocysteine lyase
MNAPIERAVTRALDLARVRADFPALAQRAHGHPLTYLDSAATALKPQSVIDAVTSVYAEDCANIHRAVHTLSQRATQRYEEAREKARAFFNAASVREVIFVRGATEGINLVAQSWGRANVGAGDEIVLTELEHHSNIVPWQMLAEATGAKIRVVRITDDGDVPLAAFEGIIGERTKLVAIAHASNALGTILPIAEIVALAHAAGAKVLVDGAQGAPHLGADVRALGCDFYVSSGHKMYGPTGIGVLFGRESILTRRRYWASSRREEQSTGFSNEFARDRLAPTSRTSHH